MKFKIVTTNTTKMIERIKSFTKAFSKINDEMHVLAVSVLHHAAKHRDTRPLNKFYSVLPVNLQKSLKLYVNRLQTEQSEVTFLRFKDDEFQVLDPNSLNEGRFAALASAHLINPDGSKYTRFYERDVVKENAVYGDTSFLDSMKKARARAVKEGSKVTPAVVVYLDEFIAKAKRVVEKAA